MSTLTLEGIIGFLLDTPMFAGLEPEELTQIVHIMQVQRVRGGQRVFREGEAGDAWYVAGPAGDLRLLRDPPFPPPPAFFGRTDM